MLWGIKYYPIEKRADIKRRFRIRARQRTQKLQTLKLSKVSKRQIARMTRGLHNSQIIN